MLLDLYDIDANYFFLSSGVKAMPFHAALEPLKWLEGTWRSDNDGGQGEYPTIQPFRYGEEVPFERGT
jgi:hypothetical protein